MANYIYPAPGVADVQAVLTLNITGNATNLTVPSMSDITINASNDVFSWTQLDSTAKKQVATTSTNSIALNVVLDSATFFGTSGTASGNTAVTAGIFGMSNQKDKVDFELYLGDEDSGNIGQLLAGSGYITGLAPTVSADSPVWVSPVTITVDGEFTVTTD